ncbi:MAG: peptide chain release factor N(5)-glutamine methyltransferase [Pyrinomonadaceae bacterium]
MSLTLAQAVAEASQILQQAGVPEDRREAASLLGHVMRCGRAFIVTHASDPLSLELSKRFHEFVERRAAGEPLQYITGRQAFFNLDFEVTRDVLIPRPETELLVEAALDLLPMVNEEAFICDVGTGSGCVAISLLHERPHARALGLDISLPALDVARKNSLRLQVNDRLTLAASDCLAAVKNSPFFSMIVSNPPYVAEGVLPDLQREVRDHEPRLALEAGADGLAVIRRLLQQAPDLLAENGCLLFEIGFDQNEAVTQLIDESIWEVMGIYKDLQGIPRTVALRKKQ